MLKVAVVERSFCMSWFLSCPICDKPITKLSQGGSTEVTCPQCRFHYQVLSGNLVNWSTRVETAAAKQKPPRACRHYDLRLEPSAGQVIASRITTPSEAETLSLCQGDQIVVISLNPGKGKSEVITLINRTTQETIHLLKPGQKSRRLALKVGAIATVLSGGILAVLAPQAISVDLLASLPVGVTAGVTTWRRFLGRSPLTPQQIHQLQRQGELLRQQVQLQNRLTGLQTDQAAHLAVAEKFHALQEKLANLPEALQQQRRELIKRVLEILQQQLAYDQQLIEGYSQILTALEVEYEATCLTAELPENLIVNFNRHLAELEVVEQHRQQLTAELDRKVAF